VRVTYGRDSQHDVSTEGANVAEGLNLPAGRAGVLPCQYLEQAITTHVIDAGRFTIPRENV
jgi:hypothetical protein